MKERTRLSKFKTDTSIGLARIQDGSEEICAAFVEGIDRIGSGIGLIFRAFKFEKPKPLPPPLSPEESAALQKRAQEALEKVFDQIFLRALESKAKLRPYVNK
jgi:hypothetical protein